MGATPNAIIFGISRCLQVLGLQLIMFTDQVLVLKSSIILETPIISDILIISGDAISASKKIWNNSLVRYNDLKSLADLLWTE